MTLYVIALLPLCELLHQDCPDVLQLWYADDAAMVGTANDVAASFTQLCNYGPMFGYFKVKPHLPPGH